MKNISKPSASSSSEHPSAANSSSSWTRKLESITVGIQHRTVKQQRLLDRTQAAGDCSRAKTLIKSYLTENANDVASARTLLKNLNEECSKSKNTILIRTSRALGLSFQKAIEDSNFIEKKLMERVRSLESEGAARRVNMMNSTYDADLEDDTATLVHMPNDDAQDDDQELQQAQTTDENTMSEQLWQAAFHERNKEIGFLLEGVKEINDIMHDLNVMVQEQGIELDKVEENTMSAHASTVKAAEQLRKASGHQKEGGKWWLLSGILIFAIILVVSIVVATHL